MASITIWPLPIGQPCRLARAAEKIGDAFGRSALRRESPDTAFEIDRQRTAVGRRGADMEVPSCAVTSIGVMP